MKFNQGGHHETLYHHRFSGTHSFHHHLSFGVGDGNFFNMGVVGDRVDVTISVEALRTP
jgi:hypothetical protein